MSAWSEFYSTRAHKYSGYRDYCKIRYAPFISKIIDRMVWGSAIAEIGCGMATITSILRDVRPTLIYYATDIDRDMIDLARIHLAGKSNIMLGQQDARQPIYNRVAKFDIVHSHGLLEHFDNHTIREIINAHSAAYQIHYVPGQYERPSFGDERLMSVDQWKAICNPDEVHTFNLGLDYTLIFYPSYNTR